MATRTITIGCRDYDHTRALADGRVKVDGVDIKFINISPPSQIFLRMLRDEEFDALGDVIIELHDRARQERRSIRRDPRVSIAGLSSRLYLD